MKVRFLIIGGGPTGLGAAYRLRELGEKDFLVIEAEKEVGGLSRSFTDDNGFVWDVGGHVQFSHYPYFDAVMKSALSDEQWLKHERESWVWMRDRFIPYPLQNNLRHLPPSDLWKCVEGLVDANRSAPKGSPAHFGEWMRRIFGSGLAHVFLEPYNFKVWATPPEKMAYHWIGERVSVVDLRQALRGIVFQTDDLSWGPNHTFRFPHKGGTGAVWRRVGDLVGRDSIRLGSRVSRLDSGKAVLESGEEIRFEHCLSTIPLDRAIGLLAGAPAALVQKAARLHHTSTHVCGVGVEGPVPPALKGKCWIYFPEPQVPFYRVTHFSHYSPQNVPDPSRQYSLMTEVSESAYKPVQAERLLGEVVAGLRSSGLILPGGRVVSEWSYTAPYGYPVPTLERDEILADLIPYLEGRNIWSRGRFGGWKYEVSNQDHSLMQGVEWANARLRGERESTFVLPEITRKAA